jgi:hypothetical protein
LIWRRAHGLSIAQIGDRPVTREPLEAHRLRTLAPYDVSVNGVFFGTTDLDPPPSWERRPDRYVNVTNLAEGTQSELLAWTKQTGRTPDWM